MIHEAFMHCCSASLWLLLLTLHLVDLRLLKEGILTALHECCGRMALIFFSKALKLERSPSSFVPSVNSSLEPNLRLHKMQSWHNCRRRTMSLRDRAYWLKFSLSPDTGVWHWCWNHFLTLEKLQYIYEETLLKPNLRMDESLFFSLEKCTQVADPEYYSCKFTSAWSDRIEKTKSSFWLA